MKEELIQDILKEFGENATTTQAVEFIFNNGLVSPKGLRDYSICKEIKNRGEGVSRKKAMLNLEADGSRGVANGASYSTIYRVYVNNSF